MSRILYLECASGISGDMTVAALLDLGADPEILRKALNSLPVTGFQIQISRVSKGGLDACDFGVALDPEHENRDHDMEYLHGRGEKETGHGEPPSGHVHSHRGLKEILALIEQADVTERARDLAVRTFQILARAEAKAHGVSVEKVHFHEVGAVDSIVDILAAAVCLDNLGVREVALPRLRDGQGTIRCQHGIIPVPVPAVVNIVQEQGLNLELTGVEGELVTPTGAALAAAMKTTDRLPSRFRILKTGLGAGKRTYEVPGILRAMLLEAEEEKADRVWKLETNVDDSTGEMLGHTMNRLLEEGARDVCYQPVYMKKNRPAYQLNVICAGEDVEKMEEIIFQETTTIGIRRIPVERRVLPRRIEEVPTAFGPAKVKVCSFRGQEWVYPEYESAAALAREQHISYRAAFSEIRRAGEAHVKERGPKGEKQSEER